MLSAKLFLLLPVAQLLMGCSKPLVDVPTTLTTIGQATPVEVRVHGSHGVRELTAIVEQNGAPYQVW
jgi:hypothetical protein